MKYVLLAIICALLLTSSALAGNFAIQTNDQTSMSASSYQSAANFGMAIGDDNKLRQSNDQFAGEFGNVFGYIEQDAVNMGITVGKDNEMTQKNYATAVFENWANDRGRHAWAIAVMDNVLIEQLQANLGIQVGYKNDMDQKNRAKAEMENEAFAATRRFDRSFQDGDVDEQVDVAKADADAVAVLKNARIAQSQANLAVQVGSKNEMDQSNRAKAEIENEASASSSAFSLNDEDRYDYVYYINVLGHQVATGANVFYVDDQKAIAKADAEAVSVLKNVKVDQSQANLAVQVGSKNEMDQSNRAKAEIENEASANARASAINGIDGYQYAKYTIGNFFGIDDQVAVAKADADALAILKNAKIDQCQANLAVQVGSKNEMDQSNRAKAEIENEASANAIAFGMNKARVHQESESTSLQHLEVGNFYGYLDKHTLDLQDQVAVAKADADSDAILKYAKIEQCQGNLGVQVGKKNDLYQRNIAEAEIENEASANARAFAGNYLDVYQTGNEVGVSSDQKDFDRSYPDATAKLYRDRVEQTQCNLGVQVGKRNDLMQGNYADSWIENDAFASRWDSYDSLHDSSIVSGEKNIDVQVGRGLGTFQGNYFDEGAVVSHRNINWQPLNALVEVS